MSVELTDISFYQSDPNTDFVVDFAKMATQVHGVICRVGQNLWIDREFKDYWSRSKGILPRGSYWFYDSRVDPKQQAELWADALVDDAGEIPTFADFEDTYNGPFHGWKHWFDFLEHFKMRLPNKEIGIYTGPAYWHANTTGVGIPIASLAYFEQYPLWIANYGVASPLIPKPWDTWLFWQYTSKGDGPACGVESLNIDMNLFNGTLEEFQTLFRFDNTPPVEGGGDKTMRYEFKDSINNRAVRTGGNVLYPRIASGTIPGTVLTPAGYLVHGTIAEGDEIVTLSQDVKDASGNIVGKAGDEWLHVMRVGGYDIDGHTAVRHMGSEVGLLIDHGSSSSTDPEPPVEETPTANVNADVHISIRNGQPVGVTVDGDTWVKQA